MDDDVYEGLQQLGKAFEDTPNSVIRRLLEGEGIFAAERGEPRENGAAPASQATKVRRPQERTPQTAFRLPILEALVEMRGRGRVADVLALVERKMKGRLTQWDHTRVKTGVVRWQVYARYERFNMAEEDLVTGPHGYWEITDKGRDYIKKHRSEG